MSAAINRGILLKTRTEPTETVDTGEAYFWLEGTSLKYKDDTQTVYTLSSGVTPEEVQDIVGSFITSGNNRITAVYNDAGDSFVITLVEANIVHQNLSGAGTNTHAQIDAHIANTSNPHSVTKAQVGLSNVDNTSDLDKPISNATQSALDLKVDENSPITGATKTKITYDSKGLVTAGADANLTDLGDVTVASPQLDQILKYNGTEWVNATQTTNVNAGAGVTYFLTSASSGISIYDIMSKTPANEAEAEESVTITNTSALIDAYITDSEIGTTSIDAGIWEFNYFTYVSSTSGSTIIRTELYKRTSGGTETLLFSEDSEEINHVAVAQIPTVSIVQPAFTCNATDKLLLKIYAVTTSGSPVTVTLVHSGSEHYTHFHSPLVTRHNDLAGLQGGTTGEMFHLTSAQSTDLLGGANTTLHFHNSDRDRANHTGTQLSTTISDFSEAVQDVVGAAFTDSASVDFTYNDAGNTVTASVIPGGVDHNALLNGGGNTHINHAGVSIAAGTSLNGGGDLTATRTINHNAFGIAGTYGSASTVPVFTTETTGHVSSVTATAISILSSAVSDFAAGVRAVVLTGLSIVNSAVTAADSVLVAIGKLQGQINQIITDMSVWNELITTADIIVNSNVTLTNVTELQFSAVAGRTYYLEYTIRFRSAATTTGITLTIGTSNTAAGSISCQVNLPVAADGTAALYTGSITALGDVVTSPSVATIQPDWYTANIKGSFICTTSGTVLPQFRSEVNGSNINFGTGSIALIRTF